MHVGISDLAMANGLGLQQLHRNGGALSQLIIEWYDS